MTLISILAVLLLFCACLLAPGCAGIAASLQRLDQTVQAATPAIEQAGKNAKDALENGKKIVQNGADILAEMREAEKQARVDADLDGSGGLNGIMEYGLYASLLANIGTGVVASRSGKKLKIQEGDAARAQRDANQASIVASAVKAALSDKEG